MCVCVCVCVFRHCNSFTIIHELSFFTIVIMSHVFSDANVQLMCIFPLIYSKPDAVCERNLYTPRPVAGPINLSQQPGRCGPDAEMENNFNRQATERREKSVRHKKVNPSFLDFHYSAAST